MAALTERFPELEARVCGAPLLRSSTSVRVKSFRHQYNPISMLGRGGTISTAPGRKPLPTKATNNPRVVEQTLINKKILTTFKSNNE